jgi:hypothetical protein
VLYESGNSSVEHNRVGLIIKWKGFIVSIRIYWSRDHIQREEAVRYLLYILTYSNNDA